MNKDNKYENTIGIESTFPKDMPQEHSEIPVWKSENWFYNVAPVYNVNKLILIDSAEPRTYQVDFDVDHYFDIGDSASLIGNDGVALLSAVTKIKDAKSIIIRREGVIDVTGIFTLRKNILNVDSTNFPNANKFVSYIQNLYKVYLHLHHIQQ